MTEQITDLERCWFLSPPWGNQIPPVEVNLFEKVYLKTNRTFGYCCGVQWYDDCWNYVVDAKDDFIYATKHQIIGTGQIQPSTLKKPAFVLGDRVLLQFPNHGTKQRLVLGIELIHTSLRLVVKTPEYQYKITLPMLGFIPGMYPVTIAFPVMPVIWWR